MKMIDCICEPAGRESLLRAMGLRHSVRSYRPEPLAEADAERMRLMVERVNAASGLRVQLITDEPRAFSGLLAYGKFHGVMNYLVMAGPKDSDLDSLVGYYGEQLVLYAQSIGLNSCWAGLSYTKVDGTYRLNPGEKIACYIALGYGLTPGSDHKRKTPEQLGNLTADSPQWFRRGLEAASLAPTAINQQKFRFELLPGTPPRVKALRGFSLVGYTRIYLGIARLHFELAAGRENFDWA